MSYANNPRDPDQFNRLFEQLTLQQQCEFMLKLAEHAHDRFHQRRDYEWKICFAIWTSLGTAAGLIISSTWKSNTFEIVGAACSVGLLLFAFVGCFSCWVHGAHGMDKRVREYWYRRLCDAGKLPPNADEEIPRSPGNYMEKRLTRALSKEPEERNLAERLVCCFVSRENYEFRRDFLHPLNIGQILVTVAFAGVFMGAVISKYGGSDTASQRSNISAEAHPTR